MMRNKYLETKTLQESISWPTACILAFLSVAVTARAVNYQNTVVDLSPTFYYELNEDATEGGAVDTMGNAPAPGVFNGDYANGAPQVGGLGPVEVFGGTAVPGLGGDENLAHFSNNQGHITLGDGNLFAANAMTVAFFFKAGPAEGGDRLFTNNITDATKSFQVNTANDGLVLSVDPGSAGAPAERTLFMEDNGGPDRRLIDPDSGWFHLVASTEGATGTERAANLKVWINGVDRTGNLQPNSTGWGTDTGLAKIGGRRADPTDSTTHSGAQDEVAIWLNRVLSEAEVQRLWEAALVEKETPPAFTNITTIEDGENTLVVLTWKSRPKRQYSVSWSADMKSWSEILDSHPSGGDSTSYTDSVTTEGTEKIYYKVEELPL